MGKYKGGMPMGGANMNNLMKQAQKMQQQMAKAQEEAERVQKEVENQTFEASAGGGAVKVIANGKKELVSVLIDPEVIDADDVEMLQDLILAASNEALRGAEEMMSSALEKVTGGVNMGGMNMGGLF